jgi:hypothetical protein
VSGAVSSSVEQLEINNVTRRAARTTKLDPPVRKEDVFLVFIVFKSIWLKNNFNFF